MNIKKIIPNFLTTINLLCGSLAIIFIFDGNLSGAALLVLLASVFDFLDGFSARILNAYSSIGKELDSLADLVSFGLAPAFIMFKLIESSAGPSFIAYISFLLIAFSALRLAIFNTDDKQTDQFIGLPTPANALFFVSFPLIADFADQTGFLYPYFLKILNSTWILAALTIIFSFLLISKFPLLSLKFRNLSFSGNLPRYILMIAGAFLLLLTGLYSLPLIIITYIIISIIYLKPES
jgi:CDP-diacylglycerol---serine O-phosphatidyltransferase